LEAERVQVHDFVGYAERVMEPAFGHAPVQRHLAALEPALELEARTRLRALVAATRGLAVARSLAAADALLRVLGPDRRAQIVQRHRPTPLPPGDGPCESCRASPACPSAPPCGGSAAGRAPSRRCPGCA